MISKKIKKVIIGSLMGVLLLTSMTGCGDKKSDEITVISREDGSGTRGAFTELLGIAKDDVDSTVSSAEITQSTSVMMTTVEGNESAIGYISLGALNESVKAVNVDGVAPTVDDIKNGTYKVSRPFNIATKAEISEVSQDFIDFIMSAQGQSIIEEEGYISVSTNGDYASKNLTGKITIAGSTSVAPVMDVLADAYKKLNPEVTIEIQQSGSSAGMTSTIEGACDIGMASRELKDSETSEGIAATVIAMDGIAVIVNKSNEVTNLTSEQIMKIYTGEVTEWSAVK